MKRRLWVLWMMLFLGLGPQGLRAAAADAPADRAVVVAVRAEKPPVMDGTLNDPVWEKAQAYPLELPLDRRDDRFSPRNPGKVRFAWDDEHFYLGVEFDDDDITSYMDADGEHLYNFGDLAELFIGPEDNTWYWELYVTPLDRQSVLFIPGRGMLLTPPEDMDLPTPRTMIRKDLRLETAAKADGTINDWRDADKGWTAVMAVPVSLLTSMGDKWGPDGKWLAFVGRYDYSRYADEPGPEYSGHPVLKKTNYHRVNDYARLVFSE